MSHHIRRAAALLASFSVGIFAGLNLPATAQSAVAAQAPNLVSQAVAYQAVADIPNLTEVDHNLYRGRFPDERAMRILKQAGIKVDVSLDNEKDLLRAERQECQDVGMQFVNIPLNPFHRPTASDVSTFMQVMANKDQAPVYVHCHHGEDRTGAMIGMYRMMHDGWSADDAYSEMIQKGFHPFFTAMSNMVFDYGKAIGLAAHKPSFGFIATHLAGRSQIQQRPPFGG